MKFGDMAHLPGGGPAHARCGDCHFYETKRCRKAAEIRNVKLAKLDKIGSTQRSCKYFEEVRAHGL